MANAVQILVTQVGSDFATPLQYTAASPSLSRYRMTSTFIDFGDVVGGVAGANGIVPVGFISVQYHENNQWRTGKIFTSQSGSAIATLIG